MYLAEREGFEPPVDCSTLVFETSPFSRSGTSPGDGQCKHWPRYDHGEAMIGLFISYRLTTLELGSVPRLSGLSCAFTSKERLKELTCLISTYPFGIFNLMVEARLSEHIT